GARQEQRATGTYIQLRWKRNAGRAAIATKRVAAFRRHNEARMELGSSDVRARETVAWLSRRSARPNALTLRKSLYTGGFALAHAVMCSSVSIARFLDRFFYPAFEQTPVTPPVFVIATPRSGTTFLHHLLALD